MLPTRGSLSNNKIVEVPTSLTSRCHLHLDFISLTLYFPNQTVQSPKPCPKCYFLKAQGSVGVGRLLCQTHTALPGPGVEPIGHSPRMLNKGVFKDNGVKTAGPH